MYKSNRRAYIPYYMRSTNYNNTKGSYPIYNYQSGGSAVAKQFMDMLTSNGGDISSLLSALGSGSSATGAEAAANALGSGIGNIAGASEALGGSGLESIMGGAAGGAIPGLGGIMGGLTGVGSGIQKLADNDSRNDGTAAGQIAGSAIDGTLSAFGIPTFGLGEIAGSAIGSQFNNDSLSRSYKPSGTVIGRWNEFQQGGVLDDKAKAYRQGFYGSKTPDSDDLSKTNHYELFMEPEKRDYLKSLDKEYGLPDGTLETISLIESGRASKRKGIDVATVNPNAVSPVGAVGAFQFTKGTAKDYGLTNRRDFRQSARAAAKKIAKDMKFFDGSLDKAVEAYNGGRGRVNRYYRGKISKLPNETINYGKKFDAYRKLVLGYDPDMFNENNIADVSAPPTLDKIPKGFYVRYPTDIIDYPQLDKYYKLAKMNKENKVYQKGGTVDPRAKIEIEGGEYVYNPEGLDETNFKMLDNTGKSNKSGFGFLAKGKKHAEDNSAGIKVMEGDAYIASAYLGMDGKKSGKNNPSVASTMLKYGGKALAKGYFNSKDKFGINKHNPNAVRHHLNLMESVKRKAESNKLMEKIRKGETEGIQNSIANDVSSNNNVNMQAYANGGIIASTAILSPSPASYAKKIPSAYAYEKKLSQDIKNTYNQSMERYPEREYPVYRKGGNTTPTNTSSVKVNYEYNFPESKAPVVTAKRISNTSNTSTPWLNPIDMLQQRSKSNEQPFSFELDIKDIKGQYKATKTNPDGSPVTNKKDYLLLHKTGVAIEDDSRLPKARYIKDGDFYTGANIWITQDGKIIRSAPEDHVVNHGGIGMLPGGLDVNQYSVGIEFEAAKPKGKDYEELTPSQIESGSKYIANWIINNNLSYEEAMDRVFGHHETTLYAGKDAEGNRLYRDPLEMRRQVASGQYVPRKGFGERFYASSRKDDFNRKDMSQIMTKVKELLDKSNYSKRPSALTKQNTNQPKKKLGGYTNYETYYNSLPDNIKLYISKQLKKYPKAQLGGKLADMLDEMYANDNYQFVDGSEGL